RVDFTEKGFLAEREANRIPLYTQRLSTRIFLRRIVQRPWASEVAPALRASPAYLAATFTSPHGRTFAPFAPVSESPRSARAASTSFCRRATISGWAEATLRVSPGSSLRL